MAAQDGHRFPANGESDYTMILYNRPSIIKIYHRQMVVSIIIISGACVIHVASWWHTELLSKTS